MAVIRILPVLICALIVPVAAAGDIYTNPSVSDVPTLIRSFKDPNVRHGASMAITTIAKPAVPQLVEALRADDLNIQIWSAYTLGKIGPEASTAAVALAGLLQSKDNHLRAVVARSLGQIGTTDATAIDALAESTADVDRRVRQRSVVSLGQIGPTASTSVSQLVAALADQSVRADAIRSLVNIGKGAIPLLTEALANDKVRLDAAEALRQLDPATAKQLGVERPTSADLSALEKSLHNVDRDIQSRTIAAKWLGTLGLDAAPILINAMEDSHVEVVRASSAAFADIGPAAVPLLRDTLKHESASVRAAVVDAVAAIGPNATDALPDLITALSDADRDVRHRSVSAIRVFGAAAVTAIPALIDVMQNPRDLEATRQLATKTLARVARTNHDQTVAALRESTKDSNYGVSSLAKEMLKTLDAKD